MGLQSETMGETVHILAHHPPGSCLHGWGREYTKIINRFQSTVKAQFHGHTHDDWFQVFHNESGESSTTAFIAPSVTTFPNKNPEYRIYSVAANVSHSSFGFIRDHVTWSMDLSLLSSEEDVPVWEKLYSATEDLGLSGVSAEHWKHVLKAAKDDDQLFAKMVRYKNQNRDGNLPDKQPFL